MATVQGCNFTSHRPQTNSWIRYWYSPICEFLLLNNKLYGTKNNLIMYANDQNTPFAKFQFFTLAGNLSLLHDDVV